MKDLWYKFWEMELYRFKWGNDGRGTPVKLAPVAFFVLFVVALLVYHFGYVV